MLPAGVSNADAVAQTSRTSLAQHTATTPRGRPVNIDIADLTLGNILGKGSFAVVSSNSVYAHLARQDVLSVDLQS